MRQALQAQSVEDAQLVRGLIDSEIDKWEGYAKFVAYVTHISSNYDQFVKVIGQKSLLGHPSVVTDLYKPPVCLSAMLADHISRCSVIMSYVRSVVSKVTPNIAEHQREIEFLFDEYDNRVISDFRAIFPTEFRSKTVSSKVSASNNQIEKILKDLDLHMAKYSVDAAVFSDFSKKSPRKSLLKLRNTARTALIDQIEELRYARLVNFNTKTFLECPPIDFVRGSPLFYQCRTHLVEMEGFLKEEYAKTQEYISKYVARASKLANMLNEKEYDMRTQIKAIEDIIKEDSLVNLEQRRLLFVQKVIRKTKLGRNRNQIFKDFIAEEEKALSRIGSTPEAVHQLSDLISSFIEKMDSERNNLQSSAVLVEPKPQALDLNNEKLESSRARVDALREEIKRDQSQYQDILFEISQKSAHAQDIQITSSIPTNLVLHENSLDVLWLKNRNNMCKAQISKISKTESPQVTSHSNESDCPLCFGKRDSVILTCGHTFCHTCLDSLSHTRARRCPSCHTSFSKSDVVYLNV